MDTAYKIFYLAIGFIIGIIIIMNFGSPTKQTVHDTIYVHDTVVISKEKDTIYLPLKNVIGGRGIAIHGTENGIIIESTEKDKSLNFDYNDSELLIEKEEYPVIYPKK